MFLCIQVFCHSCKTYNLPIQKNTVVQNTGSSTAGYLELAVHYSSVSWTNARSLTKKETSKQTAKQNNPISCHGKFYCCMNKITSAWLSRVLVFKSHNHVGLWWVMSEKKLDMPVQQSVVDTVFSYNQFPNTTKNMQDFGGSFTFCREVVGLKICSGQALVSCSAHTLFPLFIVTLAREQQQSEVQRGLDDGLW